MVPGEVPAFAHTLGAAAAAVLLDSWSDWGQRGTAIQRAAVIALRLRW